MNKLFKYFMFFGVAFGFVACTDLEEDLVGEITEPITVPGFQVPVVTDGAAAPPAQLTASYAELRNSGTANHGSYYAVQEITSDEMCIAAKGGDWFDGGILIELHQHTYTPTHAFINNAWGGSYNAIGTINGRIGSGELSAEELAQARTLRAFFYWRLLDMFGNVKIVTETAPDPAQSDRQGLFNFVESELLAVLGVSEVSAGMDLSGTALDDGVSPYILNRWSALSLLGRLYLNAEVYTGSAMYDKAEICASAVIDSGKYTLCDAGCTVPNLGKRADGVGDPDNLEGYAAVFAPNNSGNPEHIFSVQYDEAVAGGMNFSQMSLHYSSQFTWNFDAQPWNGYATLEEFYNSYEDGDARKTASFIVGNQLDYAGSAVLDYAADDDDIQLNYTPSINELAPNSQREAGARPGKFSYKQGGRPDMDNDYTIFRLGQVYLMRAEARARQSGNWSDAEADVNVLRSRAKVSAYSGNMTEDEFLAERGREMYQEGVRRTDLIRFGKYGGTWWEKPASDATRELFPIPNDQIIVSNGTLTQNPGY